LKHVIVGLTLMLEVLAAAPSAGASQNWGIEYLTNSCCVIQGNRSAILSPGVDYTMPTGTVEAQTSFAQNTGSGYAGLIQIGMGHGAVDAGFSTCGVQTTLTNFYEWKPWTQSNSDYTCGKLSTIGTAVTNSKYSVMHVYDPYQFQGTWDAFLNGVLQVSANVGFATPTHVHVGSEFNNGYPFPAQGNTWACYGCNGGNPWERATRAYGDPSGQSWTQVMQSTGRYDDAGWTHGTAPTPFSISHS
jgi:hypothetical protein